MVVCPDADVTKELVVNVHCPARESGAGAHHVIADAPRQLVSRQLSLGLAIACPPWTLLALLHLRLQ
jgi:hypothetical protein